LTVQFIDRQLFAIPEGMPETDYYLLFDIF
jgi:hypothetical protein